MNAFTHLRNDCFFFYFGLEQSMSKYDRAIYRSKKKIQKRNQEQLFHKANL